MGAMGDEAGSDRLALAEGVDGRDAEGTAEVEPTVRREFADTAFWAGVLEVGEDGTAEVVFDLPENLTGWRARVWAMGHGTRVGEGEAHVVTAKNLLLRLQAPRFFVEKDEVVLSANIHNYLDENKGCERCWSWTAPDWSCWTEPSASSRSRPGARSGWTGGCARCGRAKLWCG
jgi:uncharacterized protein YfaS (alpha-2-macroglobulin family)